MMQDNANLQDPWWLDGIGTHRAGQLVVRPERAPVGHMLEYRRSCGEGPTACRGVWTASQGWRVNLSSEWLGDMLLGLGAVRALLDADDDPLRRIRYFGPRPELIERCSLSITGEFREGKHIFERPGTDPIELTPYPMDSTTFLDVRRDGLLDVHSALPMRYYLDVERRLAQRLPRDTDLIPRFTAPSSKQEDGHVVFITTANKKEPQKDYGIASYASVARRLLGQLGPEAHFTVITAPDAQVPASHFDGLQAEIRCGIDATACIDLFASAQIVIGNDTGLTHLAALSTRPDGGGPDVIGIYSSYPYTKWTTGSIRHHAVTTWFSRMLAACDREPRGRFSATTWGSASTISAIPPALVADFAAQLLVTTRACPA